MRHVPRALSRTALATATVLAATSGLTGVAVAEDPVRVPATGEVVIPDPGRYKPRGESVGNAGATGYVHRQEGRAAAVWTDYATGADTALPTDYVSGHSGLYATLSAGTPTEPRTVTVNDLGTGTRTELTLPAGQQWTQGYNADTVLTYTADTDKRITGLFLRRSVAGETVEQPVTGLGTAYGLSVLDQDARGARLSVRTTPAGANTPYVLDYRSGVLAPAPAEAVNSAGYLGSSHYLFRYGTTDTVYTVPRDNPPAAPVATPLPQATNGESAAAALTTVGDWIIVRREEPAGSEEFYTGAHLRAVPLGGGPVRDLLPYSAKGFTTAPDGSVLVTGGKDSGDWAVRRITLGEDGAPRLSTVREVPQVPAVYSGLAVGGGRVNYISDSYPLGGALYEVDAAAPDDVRRRHWFFSETPRALQSRGDGQSVFTTSGFGVWSPLDKQSYEEVDVPAGATLLDAGGRYTVSTDATKLYVGDFGDRTGSTLLLTLPRSAAALWGTKLWKPAAGAGKVNAYDLVTKTTSADVTLGSGCLPSELQAVGRWLYWACAGGAKAGVYDQKLKKSVSVPAGEALLGDGYVVRRDNAAGKLLLTDATTGLTSEFADVPVTVAGGSGRRVDWAVDKFGGGVAYVDAQRDIHVRNVPVAPQPPAILGSVEVEPAGAWEHRWRLSRPADWTLTIRSMSGRLVRTLTGEGGEGASIAAAWDGKETAGNTSLSGHYRYTLEVREPGGTTVAARESGDVWTSGTVMTTVPSTYKPLPPKRVLDTRTGVGARKAKLVPWQRFSLKVAGAGGVPATGVTSVVLNVTVTEPTKPGHITLMPGTADAFHPSNASSQVNFVAGQTTSNLVVVPVVDGKVEFYANTAGATHLVADVSGYYAPGTAGSAYQPLTPTRFMDTRSGTGVPRAKIGPGGTARLQVTGARGVPASGVTAVVMNVTATNATSSTFVTAYPDGTARPDTSSVNVPAGRTVAGLVVVPVVNGKVAFTNRFGSLDLVGDVVGYYTSGSGAAFTGTESTRLMDTRGGQGVRKGAVGPGQSVTLPVAGVGAVPAGAKAVVLNVTATQPTTAGYVSVHPSGQPRTSASSLNFRAGQTVPNMVVVPVVDGKVTFYNHSGSVQLIADVEGWFA